MPASIASYKRKRSDDEGTKYPRVVKLSSRIALAVPSLDLS